jgi:hypothetical protein
VDHLPVDYIVFLDVAAIAPVLFAFWPVGDATILADPNFAINLREVPSDFGFAGFVVGHLLAPF